MRSKDNIDKNHIIKKIIYAYDNITKINLIVITILIDTRIMITSRSTLHIAFKIDTIKTKKTIKSQEKVENTWYYKTAIINNMIYIVRLDLFVNIDLYFGKAQNLYEYLFIILDKLNVAILFCKFYHFISVI